VTTFSCSDYTIPKETEEDRLAVKNAERRFRNQSQSQKEDYWNNYFCTKKTWQL
jgi:hypothetical protein